NKVDYATLATTDKWPLKINEIDIEVIKPKYTPDAFTLVVRYVPQELDEKFVENEIQRTIASASRIKRIQYNYHRKLNDYRFEVKDYQEYCSILKLGRIAIGYSWLSITPFYPGNRLTYCTKCWCIGHLRNNCNSLPKCRICLETFTENTSHSLDAQCQVIQDYKQRLKDEVDEAIKSGKLQRVIPKEQAPTFELNEQDFPSLGTNINKNPSTGYISQNLVTRPPITTTTTGGSEMLIGNINNNVMKLVDSMSRLEGKVDQVKSDLKVASLDIQLHQAVLADTIEIMKEFIQKFIPQSLTYNKTDRASLIPMAQQLFNRFSYAAINLREGFEANRKISRSSTYASSNNIEHPVILTSLLS
ncbi:unnamed protein product, partial [Rotaria magnacalcarata]